MSDALQCVSEQNLMLEPGGLHMEVMDLPTRRVWQSRRSLAREAYDAMELEPPLVKVGIGRGAMDEHWFRRSPGAPQDGQLACREIDGREFVLCAMPVGEASEAPAGPEHSRRLLVNKHHSLLFRAGRRVDYLRLPGGLELIHVIAAAPGARPSWRCPGAGVASASRSMRTSWCICPAPRRSTSSRTERASRPGPAARPLIHFVSCAPATGGPDRLRAGARHPQHQQPAALHPDPRRAPRGGGAARPAGGSRHVGQHLYDALCDRRLR